MAGNGEKGHAESAPAISGWQVARQRVRQLEFATERMSPKWFAGNIGIVAAAALTLLTAVALGFCLLRIQELSQDIRQLQTALLESMTLQEALDDSSVMAREYVSTHDARTLEARQSARTTAKQSLDRLHQLVPEPLRYKPILDAALRRLRAFDVLLATPRGSNSSTLVADGEAERSKLVRDSIVALSAFRVKETSLLRDVQLRIREDLQYCVGLVLFAGFVTPLFGAIGMRLLRRVREDQRTRELQTELMHVQRQAIMGETSAMLAHEINQPLAAANNYLSVLRRHLEAGATDKALAMAERLQQQIHRTANILGKLRRFIEKRESERSLESPEMLVEDAITLLGTIDSTVELKTDMAANLPHVLVDRVQMQQVLVNLMRNAIEAMHSSPRRELNLAVTTKGKGMIQISLADTGPGLPPGVAERLFQPFVSTKSSGMGVGLSICHSIIANHGGRIWAEPNVGGGTVFHFVLPAAEKRAAA